MGRANWFMVRFASAEQHEPRAGAAAAATSSAGRQLTTAQNNLESTLLMRLQSNAHKNVCDERLSIVRQHGRFPKLAVVAILDDDLMSKSFAVEPAWRQALKSAGYYRTASGITATFLLSKQQRLRKRRAPCARPHSYSIRSLGRSKCATR